MTAEKIEYVTSYEEIDAAMIQAFSGFRIDGKKVPVIYYSPDVDLAKQKKPSIILYRTSPFYDAARASNDRIKDNYQVDETGNLLSVDIRKYPEPFSVMYTVKTLYEYQQDGVALQMHLSTKFLKGSSDFISIKGQEYDVSFLTGGLWGSQYKDFGATKDGDRDFQDTYSYRVDALIDVHPRQTVKVAKEFIPNLDMK